MSTYYSLITRHRHREVDNGIAMKNWPPCNLSRISYLYGSFEMVINLAHSCMSSNLFQVFLKWFKEMEFFIGYEVALVFLLHINEDSEAAG